ncbi:sensor histidine kinase [Tianweitania sp. Rool2]|uniref:histidine kinase n=1 Tax=Oryzicola mucosus TaxID=2767425 RepID=A0A8J6PP61_9HYPH|nr:sensor histidine kinase [Oryzicola mucosus]MBD0417246.1 sensor histidine kinase [Oryzicola mucosus]
MPARFAPALLQASRNAGVAVAYHDLANELVWAHNFERYTRPDGSSEMTTSLASPRMVEMRSRVASTGKAEGFEISSADDAGLHWFDVWIDPDVAAEGRIEGLVTTLVETTEHKRRDQTLKALLREVSHRSRNLLAIAQSIATQTGRYTDTIEAFLGRFRGRLQALATSQDLVTSSNWRGAGFRETVTSQMARYTQRTPSALKISGADPYLNPNAALHVALAIHELTVNSVSHGALKTAGGEVTVTAKIAPDPSSHEPQLTIVWCEHLPLGPSEGEIRRRFGSVTLERAVPAALNGTARLEIGPGEVCYQLIVPGSNFETATTPAD